MGIPLILSDNTLNNLGPHEYDWPSGKVVPTSASIQGVRGQTRIRLIGDANGQGMQYKSHNWKVKDTIFYGTGQVHLDSSSGKNKFIEIDNCEFDNPNGSGIHFTSGLEDSKITNNSFRNCRNYGIYGYNYSRLTIANNEFIDNRAGMHIDCFDGGDLLVEQNYVKGVVGMGMEFQSTAQDLVFQDNYYELPSQSTDNNNRMAYSLILDKSAHIRIRRNYAKCPLKTASDTYVVIIFEVGGDDTIVEDNYSYGGNHVVAMNDGVGTASVTVQNNRFEKYAQGISNSFPSPGRTLTMSNNGPTTALTWDINRGRPYRNQRYGTVVPPPTMPAPTIIDPPQGAKLFLNQMVNAVCQDSTQIGFDLLGDGRGDFANGGGTTLSARLPSWATIGNRLQIKASGPGGNTSREYELVDTPPTDPCAGVKAENDVLKAKLANIHVMSQPV